MEYKKLLEERADVLTKRKVELMTELDTVTRELNAIKELLSITSPVQATVMYSPDATDYPIDGNLRTRIVFTLQKIKEGSANDIEEYMRKHEPNVSSNSVTITASQLLKNGIIKGYKQGLKNIYHL